MTCFNLFTSFMLAASSRFFAKKIEFEHLIKDATNVWRTSVYPIDTYNPTNKQGKGILKISKLVNDIELCSAEILDKKKLLSVGCSLDVQNSIPIPFGSELIYKSEVAKTNKNRVVFNVTITDVYSNELVAKGTHERAVIGVDKN